MDSNLCWLPTLNKHSLTSCVAIDLVISFSLQLLCHFCDNWKVPHSADCSKDYETPPPFLFAKCIHKNNEYIIWISFWKNEAATSFIEFKCLMFKWENRKINNSVDSRAQPFSASSKYPKQNRNYSPSGYLSWEIEEASHFYFFTWAEF